VVVIHTDKCRYEIQEEKEVPVWYTGPFRSPVGRMTNMFLREAGSEV
jgi:hypothetical protein